MSINIQNSIYFQDNSKSPPPLIQRCEKPDYLFFFKSSGFFYKRENLFEL